MNNMQDSMAQKLDSMKNTQDNIMAEQKAIRDEISLKESKNI